jgi:hypothetical protein
MSVDRNLIRWLLVIAALVFGALWFLSVAASGFTFLCLAVAVALP